jgi:hypothetical protein
MSDYNLKSGLDAPKSILETEKTLKKTLSSGRIYKKNQKTQKNLKNPLGWVFSNPTQSCSRDGTPGRWCAGRITAGDSREKSAKPPFLQCHLKCFRKEGMKTILKINMDLFPIFITKRLKC